MATWVVTGICLFFVVGCNNYRKLNERNPHFQKAEAARARGDYDSAEAYFLECLKFSPDSMKAHLQLAILYEEQKKDYPRAIVHFKSYLESVGQNEDIQRMLNRVERLYLEELTRKHVGQPFPIASDRPPTTSGTATTRPPVTVVPTTGGTSTATGQRTYVVQEGDNLSGISIKVYGTSTHWDRIFKANARTLKSPEKIKVGQTLIIPHVSE